MSQPHREMPCARSAREKDKALLSVVSFSSRPLAGQMKVEQGQAEVGQDKKERPQSPAHMFPRVETCIIWVTPH